MKIIFIIVGLAGIIIFILSGSKKTKNKEGKTVSTDPNELTPGPIQHEDLTDDQLQKIESIFNVFEEVYPITFEKMVTNFKRDLNIDKEINYWIKMKDSFEFVIETKSFENEIQRKEAFKVILMRTMMPSDEVKESIELTALNTEEIEFILSDFDNRITE